LSLPLFGSLAAGRFEDRRDEVDEMAGGVPQLAAGGDAPGPVNDQRRRDPALVNPRLVSAEWRVGQARPARPDAEEGSSRAALGMRIVTVATDHDFGTGAVVREEKDNGVVPGPHCPNLSEDTANFTVHAVNHRRMNGHLARLEFPLIRGEVLPGKRTI